MLMVLNPFVTWHVSTSEPGGHMAAGLGDMGGQLGGTSTLAESLGPV